MLHVNYHKAVEKIKHVSLIVAAITNSSDTKALQKVMGEYIDVLLGTKQKTDEIANMRKQLEKEVSKGDVTLTNLEKIDKNIVPVYESAVKQKIEELHKTKDSIEEALDILDLSNY